MNARLFEDLVVSAPVTAARRPAAPLPLSIVVHAGALALALLVPTVRRGDLPAIETVWRTPVFHPAAAPPRVAPASRPPAPRTQAVASRPAAPAAVPPAAPGPLPTLDEPATLPPDDAPSPCLHGCDAAPGRLGSGDGTPGGPPPEAEATGGGGPPIRIHDGLKPPVRVAYVAPTYPAIAITARVGATVILDCTIAADGRVTDVRVIAGHPLFTAAAVDAVRRWRYSPTLLNGVPVPVLMTVTVRFSPGR